MEEESDLRKRVTKLEAQVARLERLVAKHEARLSKSEQPTTTRLVGGPTDRVSRSLNPKPDQEFPRREGPQILDNC